MYAGVFFYPRIKINPSADQYIFVQTSCFYGIPECPCVIFTPLNIMPKTRKTLVFLHGHGVDASIWDDLDNLLNQDYRIIRPDLSLQSSCHTMEEYADELFRMLQNAIIEKCILIGHSMGGYISLAFAAKYPGMLEGFGLFHSTAYADTPEKKEQRTRMAELLRTQSTADFIRLTGGNMFSPAFKKAHTARVSDHIARFGKLPAEALAVGAEAMRERADTTEVLRQLPFPVLMIIGLDDQIIPFDKALELAAYPARCYPFVLSNAGHLGMIEQPDASASLIRWYVDYGKEQ